MSGSHVLLRVQVETLVPPVLGKETIRRATLPISSPKHSVVSTRHSAIEVLLCLNPLVPVFLLSAECFSPTNSGAR
jgi:hypothetical protein